MTQMLNDTSTKEKLLSVRQDENSVFLNNELTHSVLLKEECNEDFAVLGQFCT